MMQQLSIWTGVKPDLEINHASCLFPLIYRDSRTFALSLSQKYKVLMVRQIQRGKGETLLRIFGCSWNTIQIFSPLAKKASFYLSRCNMFMTAGYTLSSPFL